MRTQHRPTKDETVLSNEERAFKLRVKGWSQERIAKHLGMTQQGISKALKRATKNFAKAYLADVKAVKDEQVAQLENAAHEAIQAWYESKKIHKTKRTKVRGTQTPGTNAAERINQETDQYGDPRYLAEFRKAKEDIRKILGTEFVDEESDEPITAIKITLIKPDEDVTC